MDTEIVEQQNTIEQRNEAVIKAGLVANQVAAQYAFDDYKSRKSANTLRTHYADLQTYSIYIGEVMGDSGPIPQTLMEQPEAWLGTTWGLVEGFVKWMLQQGYAMATVNHKLSTVRTYAGLAAKARVISETEAQLIATVRGYGYTESVNVDKKRPKTRISTKKAASIDISTDKAMALLQQPDTPQGRRDAVIIAMLLWHGLRVGELAILARETIDLNEGEFHFYRPKVERWERHRLYPESRQVLEDYIRQGDAPVAGLLLRPSFANGRLNMLRQGMSERAITQRVKQLGIAVGFYEEKTKITPTGKTKLIKVGTLSAHDGRHSGAKRLAEGGKSAIVIRDWGGWDSIAMPARYVERAKIGNEQAQFNAPPNMDEQ